MVMDALTARNLKPVYQPIVDLKTGSVSSLEALVRWQHPERGMIHPADFLAVAAESSLIVDIGELDSRVGKTVIAAAVWDDLFSLFLLALLIAFAPGAVAVDTGNT